MKLLGSPNSPYVRKARIALIEKRIACDFVPDRPSAPGSQVPLHNPLGKVPVLVRDDGRALYDSAVIVEYFDGIGSGARLIPDRFEDRIEVKRLEALGDGVADAVVSLTHDPRYTATCDSNADWHQKQVKKIVRGLAALEQELGAHEFFFADAFSLADICAGMALGYLDKVYPAYDWRAQHPGLKRCADRLFLRDSFRQTAP